MQFCCSGHCFSSILDVCLPSVAIISVSTFSPRIHEIKLSGTLFASNCASSVQELFPWALCSIFGKTNGHNFQANTNYQDLALLHIFYLLACQAALPSLEYAMQILVSASFILSGMQLCRYLSLSLQISKGICLPPKRTASLLSSTVHGLHTKLYYFMKNNNL